MATPKQAIKQARDADRLHKEIYTQTEAEQEPTETEEAAEIVAQAEAAETPATEQVAEAPPEETQEEQQPEIEEPGGAPEPVQASDEAPQKKRGQSDDWEQKYRTLQGMNQSLREQIQGMQAVLSTLQAPKQEAVATEAPRFLKDEEVSEYGEELIDVVRRIAREELYPVKDRVDMLSKSSENFQGSLSRMTESMAQSARETVYAALSESVPNWEAINKDRAFIEWLGEVDAYAARKRGEMLKEAFEANDAARVVRFFKGFLNETASLVQDETEPTGQRQRKPQANLSSMVAPGRPRGGAAATAQDDKKLWTQEEVRKFYADIQKGRYKGKDKERLRIEKDIIAAANEGRIAA